MLSIVNLSYRTVKALRGCCLISAVLVLLLLIAGCVSLVFMAGRATAASPEGPDIMLVLDQSRSLWELGGTGSDPEMLRVDAARLFINTLGVDQEATYRLGIIFFGTGAELVAPLTPLANSEQRQALLEAVIDPQPMGWTDVNEALTLAGKNLFPDGQPAPDRQPVVILMTDGRPETETTTTDQAQQAYLKMLEAEIRRFEERETVFHTILLSSQATDTDPRLQTVYRPLWIRLSQEFDNVHFHEARSAADLPAIYHTIAVALQGARTAGPLIDGRIGGRVVEAVEVESGLRRVTFVIRKSDPNLSISILRPDGMPLQADPSQVQFVSDRLQEVWSIHLPEPGTWRITLDGQGEVTIWKDYIPLPTPTNTPTHSPTNTPTNQPTNTPTPTATPIPLAGPQIESSEAARPPRPWMPIALVTIVIVGLLTTVGGYAWSQWERERPAPVDGRLRLVRAPADAPPRQPWDLTRWHKTRVTIGGAGSDVPLTHSDQLPTPAAEIIGRRSGNQDIQILLRPTAINGLCQINGRPVRGEQPLWDRDQIQIGDYVLRYENLSRPSPMRGRRDRRLEIRDSSSGASNGMVHNWFTL